MESLNLEKDVAVKHYNEAISWSDEQSNANY
jgi:hypothetical protein